MGVYCHVNVCVRREAPLDPAARARVVALCVEHAVLRGSCRVEVPEEVAPEGPWEWVRKNVLRQPLGEDFGARALFPMRSASRGARTIEERRVERWDDERIAEIAGEPTFAIWCEAPGWRNADTEGFVYLASARAVPVRVVNAYQSAAERSPFQRADGYVGSFFDVLSIAARRGLDGRIASGSPLVRAIGKTLGVKLTCRASWT